MLSLLVGSCKEKPVKLMDTTMLSGKWLIVNAKRNAKQTTTLNEAYFVFGKDSTVVTNFMGQEIRTSYKINGNTISHSGNGHDEIYDHKILSLSRDSLILSTQIMDFDFEFYLLNDRLDPFGKRDEEDINLLGNPAKEVDIES